MDEQRFRYERTRIERGWFRKYDPATTYRYGDASTYSFLERLVGAGGLGDWRREQNARHHERAQQSWQTSTTWLEQWRHKPTKWLDVIAVAAVVWAISQALTGPVSGVLFTLGWLPATIALYLDARTVVGASKRRAIAVAVLGFVPIIT